MPPTGIIRHYSSGLSWLQRLIDVMCIVGVLYGAVQSYRQQWTESYSLAVAIALFLFGLVAEYNGLYRSHHSEGLGRELTKLAVVWILVFALLLTVAFATKTSTLFSRIIGTIWFTATLSLFVIGRLCVRIILRRLRIRGRNLRSVAIVGCTPLAGRLIDVMSADPTLGLNVSGNL